MKNKKGFTLIEVILSIALIALIAVTILGIFGTGVRNIVRAGNRTEAVFQEQESIDSTINSYDSIEGEDTVLEIDFDGKFTVDVEGKIATSSENNIILKTFVPKPQPN